jgi:hypothetical protein
MRCAWSWGGWQGALESSWQLMRLLLLAGLKFHGIGPRIGFGMTRTTGFSQIRNKKSDPKGMLIS